MGLSLLFSWKVVSNSATPQTAAQQAPLSMGFLEARTLEWVAISPYRISPTQGSNPGLLNGQVGLYR